MKKLLFTIALLLMAGSASATTYLVHSGGSDTSPYDTEAKAATQVENVLDNVDVEPGDTIQLRSDITEADNIAWGTGDEGSAAGYVTIDLNRFTLSSSAERIFTLGDTLSYAHITNGTLKAGSTALYFIYSANDGDHLKLTKLVFADSEGNIDSVIIIGLAGAEVFDTIKIDSCFYNVPDAHGINIAGEVTGVVVTNTIFSTSGKFSLALNDDAENDAPTVEMLNCVFVAADSAVSISAGCSPLGLTITNSIFSDGCTTGVNDASGTGDDPVLDYNCWDAGTDVTNCSKGAHALTEDPQFRNTAKASTYGLQLRGSSPCINAGTSGGSIPETDIDGYKTNGIKDIGAHEWAEERSILSEDDD